MNSFGNYQGIWLKNKKIHSSSKNDLTMTRRSFNDIFFGISLVKGKWIRGTPKSWFQTLVEHNFFFVYGHISTQLILLS